MIETSGVADPSDIVRNLMDPVIWREAPLETVLCVVDATVPVALLADPLLRSQVRAADVVALSKPDLADADGLARLRDIVRALRPGAVVVEELHGAVPAALFSQRTRTARLRRATWDVGCRRPRGSRR